MNLRLATQPRGDYTVVRVQGEVDIATAEQLRGYLSDTLHQRIVLDLSRVPFMDCRGANMLVAAQREARAAGGQIRLAAPQPAVCKLLALTGLYLALPPFPTVYAAMKAGHGECGDVADFGEM